MSVTAREFLFRGGVRSARFPQIGATVSGVVFAEPSVVEQRDMKTGEVLRWPDGSPRLQLRVLLDTGLTEDEDDDGIRALYVRGNMLAAVRQALRQARADDLRVGGRLTVTYVGDGTVRQRGLSAPKLYRAEYTPPADTGADIDASSPVQAQEEELEEIAF